MEPITCKIPVNSSECELLKRKCAECPYKDECDMFWVSELWIKENKVNKKDSLLGPFMPGWVKPDMRSGKIISITGKYDFCCFNNPKNKDIVIISDIYVDEQARGQKISLKLIEYLMKKYDKDIFAKCVRGSSAESFWSHIGIQVDANNGLGPDMYEHPIGKDGNAKRDLGWYIVKNNNKKEIKEDLFS